MQNVTQAYAASMKSPLRNRGYIRVRFGLLNDEIQAAASLGSATSSDLYYSDDSKLFSGRIDTKIYGTLEGDFCKVDGSMLFPPRENSTITRYNTGWISQSLVSDGPVTVQVDFSQAFTWYGLTLNFGPNYPADFDIVAGGSTIEVRDNDVDLYRLNNVFTNVSTLSIVFRRMVHPDTRARIRFIQFGVVLEYTNTEVLDSTLSRRVSPISEYVPQYDFNVRVRNVDHFFDVDNPDSPVHFFNSDQAIAVMYGYELDDGTVEWLPKRTVFCSGWEADNFSATIYGQDILRNLNSEYYKGTYNVNGRTLRALAVDVLTSAGITDYMLDSQLSTITTQLPIPRVSHKEALQLIANAGRCILRFTSTGGVVIEQPMAQTANFKMEHQDMTSYPITRKLEDVSTVTVQYHLWFKSADTAEETLYNETVTVESGEVKTLLFNNAQFDYRVAISPTPGSGGGIVDSGAYFVSVLFGSAGTYNLTVYGKPFRIVETSYQRRLGDVGKPITWKNPLVGGWAMAWPLADWLYAYYSSTTEYEYDTRGNPELDVPDLIRQENEFAPNLRVRLTAYTLRFRQAFSGHVVARREGV